jgi:hypothetical protein
MSAFGSKADISGDLLSGDLLTAPLGPFDCDKVQSLSMQFLAGAANEATSIYCIYCQCSGRIITVGTSTAANETHRSLTARHYQKGYTRDRAPAGRKNMCHVSILGRRKGFSEGSGEPGPQCRGPAACLSKRAPARRVGPAGREV